MLIPLSAARLFGRAVGNQHYTAQTINTRQVGTHLDLQIIFSMHKTKTFLSVSQR